VAGRWTLGIFFSAGGGRCKASNLEIEVQQ
jgi:hypothetical protein